MRSSASMRAWNFAACAASSRLRSSASDVLSAWVYMAALPDVLGGNIYHNFLDASDSCNMLISALEPVCQHFARLRQGAALVRSMLIKPLLGWGKQRAIDLAAELSRRSPRPIRRQQFRRQQRIAQHHAAIVMDQKNARDEGIEIAELLAGANPVAQGCKRLHEFQVRIGGAFERPALAQEPPPAVVLGRDFEPDRARGFRRDGHA